METVHSETYYVANDGTRFDNRMDCVNHEIANSTIKIWDADLIQTQDISLAFLVKLETNEDVDLFIADAPSEISTGEVSGPGVYYKEYDDYDGCDSWYNLDNKIEELNGALAYLEDLRNHVE